MPGISPTFHLTCCDKGMSLLELGCRVRPTTPLLEAAATCSCARLLLLLLLLLVLVAVEASVVDVAAFLRPVDHAGNQGIRPLSPI